MDTNVVSGMLLVLVCHPISILRNSVSSEISRAIIDSELSLISISCHETRGKALWRLGNDLMEDTNVVSRVPLVLF